MSKTAQETHKERTQQAQASLAEIAAYLLEISGDAGQAHWGDVGDMAHIADLLKEITNFITNTDDDE